MYVDDVIVYSKSQKGHLEHLHTVLLLLEAAGASLKLRKCKFFEHEVDYLGHVVYAGKF